MNHGWEKKRLGDLCAYHRGLTYSKDDEVEKSSKSVLRANNINLETSTLNLDELKYLREDFYIAPKYLLSKDSILICMSSGSKSHLGKVAFIDKDSDYAFGGFMGLIIPKTNARFLYLFMTSPFFRSHLQKITNGININNLKFSTLQDVFVPVPAADVQTKIVTELDRIKALIEIKRSQLKDLDALAQSLFYETFGEPIDNPMRWNVGMLSDHADFKNGLNFTPSDNGNKVKCLGVGDFKANRYIKAENLSEFSIVESISEDYLLTKGDIIFVRSNGNKALIGRSIMYVSNDSPATFSGFCIRCMYNSDILSPLLLSYYLSSRTVREYITSQGRGCNISNLNQKILSSIPLMLPPLSLQNQFAARIEAIEAQKKRVEASIADLETLLASRMDYWFND